MNTGCTKCDEIQAETGDNTRLCPECELDYLKWCADSMRTQIAKAEYERITK